LAFELWQLNFVAVPISSPYSLVRVQETVVKSQRAAVIPSPLPTSSSSLRLSARPRQPGSPIRPSTSIASFMKPLQSNPVIALGDNAGHIGRKPVGHHDQSNPPVAPHEEDERKKKNDPVG